MKKLLFIFLLYASAQGQSIYLPSNSGSLDSMKIPINLNGSVRSLWGIDLLSIKASVVTTVAGLRLTSIPNANSVYETTDYGGGIWRWNPTDVSSDNTGTVIKITGVATGAFNRVFSGGINVEWFGAVGDFSTTTNTGTENTPFIQKAINYALIKGGIVTYPPNGKFLQNGTVYVNPTATNNTVPLTIKGGYSSVGGVQYNGTQIFRTVPGDIFRVNLDSTGKTVISAGNQYTGFAIDGLFFRGRGTTGVRGLNEFRVKGSYTNLAADLCDYLIYQADYDSSATPNQNYCDKSIYNNIYITNSTYGGVKLNHSDGSNITNFVLEDVQPAFMYGIELRYASSVNINGVVHWIPTTSYTSTLSGSAFLKIDFSNNINISGIHIERTKEEEAIRLSSSENIHISGIHTRWNGNTSFRISTVKGLIVENWTAWDSLNTSNYDVLYVPATTNQNINFKNCFFYGAPNNQTVSRSMMVSGTSTYNTDSITVANTYYPATGGSYLSSTNGTGYLGFHPQTSAIATPTDGFYMYDSAGITFLRNDGFRRVISFQGITANSKFNFPTSVTADTIVTNTGYQSLSNKIWIGSLGLNTIAPTHTITLGSTSTGVAFYNTTDQTTNYSRVRQYWAGNVFNIVNEIAGTETGRNFNISFNNTTFQVGAAVGNSVSTVEFSRLATSVNNLYSFTAAGLQASSGMQNLVNLFPTVNQSSGAGYRSLWISTYEQGTGSGSKFLMDVGTNTAANGTGTHTTKFSVTNVGNVFSNGAYTMGTTTTPTPANGTATIWFDGTSVKVTKNVAGTTTTTTLF